MKILFREVENGGTLPSIYMRMVTKEEVMHNPAAVMLAIDDHPGRYNKPDNTMVTLLFKVIFDKLLRKNVFFRQMMKATL